MAISLKEFGLKRCSHGRINHSIASVSSYWFNEASSFGRLARFRGSHARESGINEFDNLLTKLFFDVDLSLFGSIFTQI
jgi:hypothetical protein